MYQMAFRLIIGAIGLTIPTEINLYYDASGK